jgi:type VI secretion system protein ImpF
MAELTPIEKLQPCLLDRLTDDEPGNQVESRLQRVVSPQKYRAGVLRDLEWLFNSRAYPSLEGMEPFQLRDYPEVCRSVINYGIPGLCGQTAPDLARLEGELSEAVQAFDPRIIPGSLILRARIERNLVTLDIEGDLWALPLPEHLHVKTTMDLETGHCMFGDAPYG